LSEWSLTRIGRFSNGKEEVSENDFIPEDYRDVKKAIIEGIRQNKSEWKIKEIAHNLGNEEDYKKGKSVVLFPREEYTMLVNKSAKFEYSNYVLVLDYGRMHYRGAFTDKEWNELEKILQNSHNQEVPPKGTSKW